MTLTPSSPITDRFRPNTAQLKALDKLGLKTLADLFRYVPARYGAAGTARKIKELKVGEEAIIFGQVIKSATKKAWRKKIPMAEATVKDETGQIKIIWFHQAYLAKRAPTGARAYFRGRVAERNDQIYLANPEIMSEAISETKLAAGDSLFVGEDASLSASRPMPVYPETRGLSSGWFHHHLKTILEEKLHEQMIDPIPAELLAKYHLPRLSTALVWIHAPRRPADAAAARKRFAFEEIFFIQLARLRDRAAYRAHGAATIEVEKEKLADFVKRFTFKLTAAQERAITEILKDFKGGSPRHSGAVPMTRLLEGDVGSGKTAVAAATAYAAVAAGYEVGYMAPTEILARQHFENFIEFFKGLNIQVGLLTGTGCYKFPAKVDRRGYTNISRSQLLKWVANGEIPILIGTHALIQKTVKWKNLAYAIIDEQHRFGVKQRAMLVASGQKQTKMPTNAEETSPNNELLYKDLTYIIRNCVFKVKKELGLGHKEIIYQKALAEEFSARDLTFNRERQIPIHYRGKKVGVYQPDFVVDEKVIVELKALPFIGQKEKRQLWTYLKGSDYKLALLINFASDDIKIDRVIYDQARQSASSPHQSAAFVPHLLSMTATPIPRTLALTIYGDLDLSLLDELPAGRKEIITRIVPPSEPERQKVYESIREQLNAGRQAYVICPRIDEPDPAKANALQTKSAKAEAKRLSERIFPEFTVALVHSKLKPKDKEEIMADFASGEIKILVATSVVEVGVNVPNATSIIIEGAERFGLAQLHQLRGRVFRSSHQAYCYLFTETKSENSLKRLKALAHAKNGFELAELDLALRGAGLLSGDKQWGISDLGMEAIKNINLVAAARSSAQALIAADPEFKRHPEIAEALAARARAWHFE